MHKLMFLSFSYQYRIDSLVSKLAVKLDRKCSSTKNCWYCKEVCVCCSCKCLNHEDKSLEGFCCKDCHAMVTLDPSIVPPVILNPPELATMLNPDDPPIIAAMKKVLPTAIDRNTILTVCLSKCDSSFEAGTLYAVCQLKTASTQVVIDCVLSKDCSPLKPVWYTEYCEQMIEKYRELLHREITLLVNHILKVQ